METKNYFSCGVEELNQDDLLTTSGGGILQDVGDFFGGLWDGLCGR